MPDLQRDYSWTKRPLVSCGPMRLIALPRLAAAVSLAGGLGFIGAGSDVTDLAKYLDEARELLGNGLRTHNDCLPIGVGFLLWGLKVEQVTSIISDPKRRPAAVWLFAPREQSEISKWTSEIRRVTGNVTKVWVQVGTVADAVAAVDQAEADVLVVQGQDAGGHGLTKGAGLIPLFPEVQAAVDQIVNSKGKLRPALVATGGIVTPQGAAAAMALGADGLCMGTRFLAAEEANIAKGYQQAVLRARDGGVSTVRSHVYDTLRGTTDWPERYGGRGVVNASFEDFEKGLDMEKNQELYEKAVKQGDAGWDEHGGRLTTYAGTGVGLVSKVQPAAEIVNEIVNGTAAALLRAVQDLGCRP